MRPNTKLEIYLRHYEICVCVITCHNVFNVWSKTTLLPVWPSDAKSLDILLLQTVSQSLFDCFHLPWELMHLCFYLNYLVWPFIQPGTVGPICTSTQCHVPYPHLLILSSRLVSDTSNSNYLPFFLRVLSLCLLQSLTGRQFLRMCFWHSSTSMISL